MGTIHHTTVIVTGWDWDSGPAKDRNLLTKAYKTAIKLFGKKTVTKLTGEGMNGYKSFMVAPCGSKVGWEMSNDYLKAVDKFIDFLNKLKHEDGSTSVEYVKLSYGELGLQIQDWRGNEFDADYN